MSTVMGNVDVVEGPVEAPAWQPSPLAKPLDRLVGVLLVGFLTADLILIFAATMMRYVSGVAIAWSNEIGMLLLASVVFLGSAVAYHRGEHRSLRLVLEVVPRSVARCVDSAMIATVGLLSIGMTVGGIRWFSTLNGHILGTDLPMRLFAVPFIAGSVVLLLYVIALLFDRGWRQIVVGFLGAAAVVGVVVLGSQLFPGTRSLTAALGFYAVVFLVVLLLGMPVGYAFALVTYALALTFPEVVPLQGLARRMSDQGSTFVLSAVPFFIAAGLIMEAGDITRRIIRVAVAFLGHIRGSMGQVTIGAMYFMSGVTGSEAADVAAVGTVMRKPMKEAGFGTNESTAILVAASVMGASVPPSIGLVIVASATQISVGALFLSGFIPAAVLAMVLMLTVYVRARLKGMPRGRKSTWRERGVAIRSSLFALGLPVIIFGGMVFGVGTPTELSSFAVAYVVVVEVLIQRTISLKRLGKVLIDTSVLTGMLLFIVAAAGGFVHVATYAGIPQAVGKSLAGLASDNSVIFLLLMVLALIPLGMLMEGIAALLVFPPLLMPTAVALGVDPIHFAMVLFIAVYIGANLPPIGAGYYFGATVMDANLKSAMPATWGYMGVITAGLIVIVLIPGATLVLPQLFGAG